MTTKGSALRKKIVPDAVLADTGRRIQSQVHTARSLAAPKTIGERMAARRNELGLSQEQVAKQVTFHPKTGQRGGEKVSLARNTYNTYETDKVPPGLEQIVGIAKALKVQPAYIAFGGEKRPEITEYTFDTTKREFITRANWALDETWLAENFGELPSDLGLMMVPEETAGLREGEIAIVRKGNEPSAVGGDFVFSHGRQVRCAYVRQVPRSNRLRVYSPDRLNHEEIAATSVHLFGEVIGKVGALASTTH